jgi:hypothetical protein
VRLSTLVAKQKERRAGQASGPAQLRDMRDKRPASTEPGAIPA